MRKLRVQRFFDIAAQILAVIFIIGFLIFSWSTAIYVGEANMKHLAIEAGVGRYNKNGYFEFVPLPAIGPKCNPDGSC